MHFNVNHHKDVGKQLVNLSNTSIFQRMGKALKDALKKDQVPQHKTTSQKFHSKAAHQGFWEKAMPAFVPKNEEESLWVHKI